MGKDKPGNQAADLTPEELKARGIKLVEMGKTKEEVSKLSMTLLEKVQVDGATRSLRTILPHSIVYATQLDERFDKDKEYPNIWKHILKLEKGFGPPHPYKALVGYVVVTELPEPKGALLLEVQFLMHEPPDWFGGPNLLRSKLGIAIQDNVRSFRRKLR